MLDFFQLWINRARELLHKSDQKRKKCNGSKHYFIKDLEYAITLLFTHFNVTHFYDVFIFVSWGSIIHTMH